MHGDLLVTADAEGTDGQLGTGQHGGLAAQLLQHLGGTGQTIAGLTNADYLELGRELHTIFREEETDPLASFYNSVGFCDELSHVFLGLDLSEVARDTQGLEEEHMTIERVALADVPAMIADGRLLDAKTIIGLTLARAALTAR